MNLFIVMIGFIPLFRFKENHRNALLIPQIHGYNSCRWKPLQASKRQVVLKYEGEHDAAFFKRRLEMEIPTRTKKALEILVLLVQIFKILLDLE